MQPNVFLRAAGPALICSLFLLVLGTGAGWYVDSFQSEVAGLTARSVAAMRHSEELLLALRDVRVRLLRYLQSSDETFLEVALSQRDAEQLIDELEREITRKESQALVEDLQAQTDSLFVQLDHVLRSPDSDGRREVVRSLVDGLLATMISEIEQLHTTNLDTLAASESRLLSVGGKVAWGLLALGVCGATAGLLAGFHVARGVAAQVEASEEAVMRADQLASVGQLAAGLAHEVRNPLMIMRLLIETGVRDNNGQIEGQDLHVLDQEISRLETLVASFSDFASPPRPEPVEFDLWHVLRETQQLTTSTAARQNVTIHLPNSSPLLMIHADQGQVKQLVLNLVLNSLNALPDGGRVRIEAKAVKDGHAPSLNVSDRDLEWLRMSVSDSGPGIAFELREQIFEPFFSTRESGLGLGLAICHRIVQLHNGTIEVDQCDTEGGARFTVWMPLRQQRAEQATCTIESNTAP